MQKRLSQQLREMINPEDAVLAGKAGLEPFFEALAQEAETLEDLVDELRREVAELRGAVGSLMRGQQP